jgi:nucleoside-diphosphate-sugar epimerase
MRVFVIGGTGAIGGHAVPALVRAGHQVTALRRSPEKSERLRRQGAMPLTASKFDRSSVSRFTAAGGIGVVLRFGWFYGPGAAHSEEFFALARQGLAIMMGARQGYVSSIHVEDAGAAVSAALSIAAGIYNIVDDEPLAKGDYADAMAKAAGRRHWLRVPGRFALLLGDRSTSLTRSLRVSNARFKAVTRWTPLHPSAREGWQAMGNAALDQSP